MKKLGEKKKFDYKWVIIALCFISIFTTLGFCSSTNSYFLEPVTEHLDVSRTSFSLVTTIRYIVVSIMNLFFGVLVVKLGPKKLILLGCLSLSLAMIIFTFANNLFLFYVGGAFLGLGFAWTGTSVIGYVVNVWCTENRGTIMGAILCANGLGGALAMRIVSKILRSGIHDPSYKAAYFIIAGVVLIIFVLMLFFFKDKPQNLTVNYKSLAKRKVVDKAGRVLSLVKQRKSLTFIWF